MKCTIKAFGITREILGSREVSIEMIDSATVADLKQQLMDRYPELKGLKSLFIAVNNVYADEQKILQSSDEVALIPPVSGG